MNGVTKYTWEPVFENSVSASTWCKNAIDKRSFNTDACVLQFADWHRSLSSCCHFLTKCLAVSGAFCDDGPVDARTKVGHLTDRRCQTSKYTPAKHETVTGLRRDENKRPTSGRRLAHGNVTQWGTANSTCGTVEIYRMCKYELPTSRLSSSYRLTDTTKIIYHAALRVVNKK